MTIQHTEAEARDRADYDGFLAGSKLAQTSPLATIAEVAQHAEAFWQSRIPLASLKRVHPDRREAIHALCLVSYGIGYGRVMGRRGGTP